MARLGDRTALLALLLASTVYAHDESMPEGVAVSDDPIVRSFGDSFQGLG
jgi:hypothetical protein